MNIEYTKYFSEKSFWQKIKKFSKAAGRKVIYAVLLLYYAMKDKNVSLKTKIYIASSLGYFILPVDAIFDLTPIIGFSDDLSVLIFAIKQISSVITPEIKEKAQNKLTEWFSEFGEKEISDLELIIF